MSHQMEACIRGEIPLLFKRTSITEQPFVVTENSKYTHMIKEEISNYSKFSLFLLTAEET